MKYQVTHRTHYQYDEQVESSYGQVYQLPIDSTGQQCLTRSITITPNPGQLREHSDFFGNSVLFYSINQSHIALDVLSQSTVDTSRRLTSFDHAFAARQPWQATLEYLKSSSNPLDRLAIEFSLDSPRIETTDLLYAFVTESFPATASLLEAAIALAQKIYSEFEFSPDATDVSTPIAEVLEKRAGVCQDFTHLMIGALRSIGVCARYVSGYLETQPPPGQVKLAGADQSHAWVDVYLGGGLWMGIDPTNNQIINEKYVTTARGRDYGDITPLRGIVFTNATKTKMDVSVDVIPLPTDLNPSW